MTSALLLVLALARPAAAQTPEDRGRYLAGALGCAACHGEKLAGGARLIAFPLGTVFAANLTPDNRSGLGGWQRADIVTALKTGRRPDGRRLSPRAMPWPFYAALPDADLQALAAYLARIPPLQRFTPPDQPFVYPQAIGYKLAHLAGSPATLDLWPSGSTGPAPAVPAKRMRLAWYAFSAAVLVVLIGAGVLVQSALSGRGRRRQAVALAGAAAMLFLGCGSMAVLLDLPGPENWDLRPPAPGPGAQLAVAACARCHTPIPLLQPPDRRLMFAGGTRVDTARGAVYTANLTQAPPDIAERFRNSAAHATVQVSEPDLKIITAYLLGLPKLKHVLPVPPQLDAQPGDPPVRVYFGDGGKLLE